MLPWCPILYDCKTIPDSGQLQLSGKPEPAADTGLHKAVTTRCLPDHRLPMIAFAHGALSEIRAAIAVPKGSRRNNFAFFGVETPDWQGARRANSRRIETPSNAVRRDVSAYINGKLFFREPQVEGAVCAR